MYASVDSTKYISYSRLWIFNRAASRRVIAVSVNVGRHSESGVDFKMTSTSSPETVWDARPESTARRYGM